ncbi:MAG: 2-C-methyl-D-erythritol 2,4-cyclodiphosphate synthase [Prevotellaceae bacterium]|jgi:2-C-methyl-D-erythritol 2,4-cyclodiphosphate synthase|nr:2-C-methyl-D-erythritol 2,4-cyclodiphosphate synthase [Prevotellaceae bacterium]
MNFRTGFGYDVHRFAEGRNLWLGGIKIAHHAGLLGHSDADVLIHALCDALLGAANLRDIGYNFPDTSAEFVGIDSKVLLEKTARMLKAKGYFFGNADCTIVAEQPKINPYIPEMQKTLAAILETDPDNISIKATTNEKMGFAGREEGIVAYATALIYK